MVLHVQDGAFQQLNVLGFWVETTQLTDVAFTLDFIVDETDNAHSLQIILHLSLVPEVGIHAALKQVYAHWFDEVFQQIVNLGVLTQLRGELKLWNDFIGVGDCFHSFCA